MTPLAAAGLAPRGTLHWNEAPADLQAHAVRRGEGVVAEQGALCVVTAPHTGRSPGDKFIVRDPESNERVHWSPVNQPMAPDNFTRLREQVAQHLNAQELFVLDVCAGVDPRYRTSIRLVTPNAWCALFMSNMLRRPAAADLPTLTPQWHILHAPELQADPARHGTRSGTFVVIHFAAHVILIGGTRYAGELKKAVFTTLNYLLPPQGVLPMHCAATQGTGGDVALFFGLSGTGKTTLSTDPERALIGDDEHGWSDRGVFNFEGGCYAKAIGLSPTREPTIYAAARMFGTVLENVVVNRDTGIVDFDSAAITENTRAAYSLDAVPNHVASGMAGHPSSVVFLTCDAYGVMPPVARLSSEQTLYHFLSGYTAKIAGTERGVTAPAATFSTCFGAPFLPLDATVYANMLGDRVARHGVSVWLVNTGWTGGAYGVGRRIPLELTRAIVRAAISGRLDDTPTAPEPVFGLAIPRGVPGVPSDILNPRDTWTDAAAYDAQAAHVAHLFRENFEHIAAPAAVQHAGPRA
jgi:phosphoenolpyruvate carboxykinase (ATP)